MEAKEFIAAMARVFEEHPERWTHGAAVRNEAGQEVAHDAHEAYKFSDRGFIERGVIEGLLDEKAYAEVYDLYGGACFNRYHHRDLARLNDFEGREAVIATAKHAVRVDETAPDPVLG